MGTKKILFVFGTRPEAIKVAPLIKEFQKNKQHFNVSVVSTGQHKEMLDQVIDFFDRWMDYINNNVFIQLLCVLFISFNNGINSL